MYEKRARGSTDIVASDFNPTLNIDSYNKRSIGSTDIIQLVLGVMIKSNIIFSFI
ncbi:hypothetical protein [Flavobacterium hercynium]|uniref:hypothetical protein n=1 Tax=Flavobacterium hercynium TaxID=387094 RepID=UPI0013FDD213|nr:hypothetical protein [Flavobacterium hercynium]